MQATPTVTWAPPATITYGTALSGLQLSATSTDPGNFVYTPAAGAILPVGTNTLSVTFTPTDTTNHSTVIKTVPLQVTQAMPVITWSNPASITYGTVLSSAQLNASSSVLGSFVYTPAAGSLPSAGTDTLSVTFTPTDTTNYTTAIQSHLSHLCPSEASSSRPRRPVTAFSSTRLHPYLALLHTLLLLAAFRRPASIRSRLPSPQPTPRTTPLLQKLSNSTSHRVRRLSPGLLRRASPMERHYPIHNSMRQLLSPAHLPILLLLALFQPLVPIRFRSRLLQLTRPTTPQRPKPYCW